MKRWIAFSSVLAVVVGSVVAAQICRVDAAVGPNALLFLVADTQRELTRMPAAFTRLPDDVEVRAGKTLAREYLNQANRQDGDYRAAQEYVTRVGGKLQPLASRKLPYEFHYVSDPSFINAFALPGGQIFVGDGLLALLDSEDELAAVLAHEMEHVDHYHCAERLQVEAALHKVPAGSLLELPIGLFQAGYTKDQELEADREGLLLAMHAGYSPTGMMRVMQTFDMLYHEANNPPRTAMDEAQRVALETLKGYFRSHPLPSERIAAIQKVVAAQTDQYRLAEQPFGIGYIYTARRAERELTAKHFDSAIQFADRALSQQPSYDRALYVRAAAQIVKGNAEAARSDYARLTACSSPAAAQVAVFVRGYAESLMYDRKWNQTVELANRILVLQPNEPDVLALKIRALVSGGLQSDAINAMASLRKLYPQRAEDAVEAMSSQGASQFAAHRYSEALPALEFVARIRNNPGSLKNFGEVLFALGRFDLSAAAFEQSLQKTLAEDLQVETFRIFAGALAAAKEKNALARFDAIAKRDTRSEHAGLLSVERLGLSLASGDAAAVNRDWQSGFKTGTISPESAERLSWWYLRSGHAAQANALLREAIAVRPSDTGLRYALFWTEIELGQQPELPVGERSSFSRPPLQLSLPLAQAIIQWRKKKYDQAITQFDAATSASPEWRNAAWRDPLQPRSVAHTASELQKESDRRRELAANRFRR